MQDVKIDDFIDVTEEVTPAANKRGPKPKVQSAAVTVICRLPNGLMLRHPVTDALYELRGANQDYRRDGMIILKPQHFGKTVVPAEFWDAWVKANKDFPALKNGAIVAITDHSDAAAQQVAEERQNERTGFEGADPKKFRVESVADKAA